MPKYPFLCQKCDHEFTISPPVALVLLPRCPMCGGKSNRVWTPVNFSFKGVV